MKRQSKGSSVNFTHLNPIFDGCNDNVKSRYEPYSKLQGGIINDIEEEEDVLIMRCPSGLVLKTTTGKHC